MLDNNGFYVTKLNKDGIKYFLNIHKTRENFEKVLEGIKLDNLRFTGINSDDCLWFSSIDFFIL